MMTKTKTLSKQPEVKEESKYTLEEAAAEMAKRQQFIKREKQERIQKCQELINIALNENMCTLRVNPESSLNALEIIIVSNT